MIDLSRAPKRGIIYALFRDRVVFERYSIEKLEKSRFEGNNLLELHLFDEDMEYRVIRTRMNGCKEMVISDDTAGAEDIYEEEVLLAGRDADSRENLADTVKVVNYINYDENDLLKICGYRLQEVR